MVPFHAIGLAALIIAAHRDSDHRQGIKVGDITINEPRLRARPRGLLLHSQ
jgi:hypothetical protein